MSDVQWRDMLGVFRVQVGRLDRDNLRLWAVALEVSSLWERALNQTGWEENNRMTDRHGKPADADRNPSRSGSSVPWHIALVDREG